MIGCSNTSHFPIQLSPIIFFDFIKGKLSNIANTIHHQSSELCPAWKDFERKERGQFKPFNLNSKKCDENGRYHGSGEKRVSGTNMLDLASFSDKNASGFLNCWSSKLDLIDAVKFLRLINMAEIETGQFSNPSAYHCTLTTLIHCLARTYI